MGVPKQPRTGGLFAKLSRSALFDGVGCPWNRLQHLRYQVWPNATHGVAYVNPFDTGTNRNDDCKPANV